ncbi:hypothetical protein J6590_048605 [Homalodisca vitripennis]|nr:hypothetical protein J6590_048605 [Homalodisca vitripennis]
MRNIASITLLIKPYLQPPLSTKLDNDQIRKLKPLHIHPANERSGFEYRRIRALWCNGRTFTRQVRDPGSSPGGEFVSRSHGHERNRPAHHKRDLGSVNKSICRGRAGVNAGFVSDGEGTAYQNCQEANTANATNSISCQNNRVRGNEGLKNHSSPESSYGFRRHKRNSIPSKRNCSHFQAAGGRLRTDAAVCVCRADRLSLLICSLSLPYPRTCRQI